MKTQMKKIANVLNTKVKQDVESIDTLPIILTQPSIDKITVNFNLTNDSPDTVKAHMHHVIDTIFAMKEFPYEGVYRVPGKGYKGTLKVYLVDKEKHTLSKGFILVQFGPFSKKAAFARVEYNPSKITPAHYAFLEKFMFDMLDIKLAEEMKKAWITRLDVCMEILNLDMEDVFIRAAKKRSTALHFGSSGKVETIYLGKSSGNQVKIYNKAKEQDKSGNHIRIEAMVKKSLWLKDLQDMVSPFLSVEIFDLTSNLSGSALVAFDLFKDSCRYRGIKNALKRLPELYQKKYGKIVSENPAAWWQPDSMWDEHWTYALDDAGLLPD